MFGSNDVNALNAAKVKDFVCFNLSGSKSHEYQDLKSVLGKTINFENALNFKTTFKMVYSTQITFHKGQNYGTNIPCHDMSAHVIIILKM